MMCDLAFLPLPVTNVDITGPNIRRRDQTGEVWRVELQNKLRGQHTFMVTWEQPRAAKTNAPVELPAVEAVGVERETGSVAILAKPPLQVSEKAASTELMRIDARELPEWAAPYASGAKGEQVVLARRSPCSCGRRREESHLFLRDQLETPHVVSYCVTAGTPDRRTCSAPLARAA